MLRQEEGELLVSVGSVVKRRRKGMPCRAFLIAFNQFTKVVSVESSENSA
jgi:hypothetical protein